MIRFLCLVMPWFVMKKCGQRFLDDQIFVPGYALVCDEKTWSESWMIRFLCPVMPWFVMKKCGQRFQDDQIFVPGYALVCDEKMWSEVPG